MANEVGLTVLGVMEKKLCQKLSAKFQVQQEISNACVYRLEVTGMAPFL